MKRFQGWASKVPRWLWVVLVVVGVAVALGLVLPYFLDIDRYRALVASAIEMQTGRKVTIGKLRARFVPKVGFVLEKLTIANPPGFAQGNFLSVEAIHGSLALFPLLRGEFRLSSLELVRPKLTLLEDDRGRSNYDFSRKKATAPPSGEASPAAYIAEIELSDAELTLARETRGGRGTTPSLHAAKLNADLSNVALDSTLLKQLVADANLRGVRLELAGLKDPVEFRSGRFTLRDGAAESKFEADLGKAARVKGSLRVPDMEKRVASFELATPLVDLDQLLGAASQAASSRSPGREVSDPPGAGSKELIAQGRLAAERLRWAPYEATGASGEVRIFADRVEIWPVMMAFYGGSLGVSAWLERHPESSGPERFSSNIQVRNLDVGQILAVSSATRGKLTGTGELTLQLFGTLGPALMNSLAGTGTFTVRDGRFPTFHLTGTMQTLAKVQRILNLGGGEGLSGATSFSLIRGDLTVGQGRIRSKNIHLDSPSGTVDLSGSFSFSDDLDYDGQAVLVPTPADNRTGPADIVAGVLGGVIKENLSRIRVPFRLRGTFHDLKLEPGQGLASLPTSSPPQPTGAVPPKKKSLLDLFRRP